MRKEHPEHAADFLPDLLDAIPESLASAGFLPRLALDREGVPEIEAGGWPIELATPEEYGWSAVVRHDGARFVLAARHGGMRDLVVDESSTLSGIARAHETWRRRACAVHESLASSLDLGAPAWSALPFESAFFAKLSDGTSVLARVNFAVPPHMAASVSLSRVDPKRTLQAADVRTAEIKALPFACVDDLDVFFWTSFAEVADGWPAGLLTPA